MSVFQVQQRQVKVATSHANERNEQRASQRMSDWFHHITASLTSRHDTSNAHGFIWYQEKTNTRIALYTACIISNHNRYQCQAPTLFNPIVPLDCTQYCSIKIPVWYCSTVALYCIDTCTPIVEDQQVASWTGNIISDDYDHIRSENDSQV